MLNWGYLQLHSIKSKRQKIDYLAEILLDRANKYTQEEMRVLSALRSIVSREKVTNTIEFLEKWIIDDQFANAKIKADCHLLLVIAYIRAVKDAVLEGRSNQTQYLTTIERHLKMGEEFDPSSAWLQFEYGNYYCLYAKISGDASNYHLALEKYKLSHSMDPSTPYSFNAIGDVCLKIQGDIDWLDAILQAKDYYCRALAICDGFAPSLNGLGNVYRETNHFKMAITYYKLAIEADPEFLYPWNYMGDCYRVLEQFPESVECYKRAIEVNQGIVFPWYGIGKVLFDVGKITRDNELFEKSKMYFKKSHQINPRFGFAYLDYGRVLENQERYQEAKSKYRKAASMFTERQSYWKLEAERYISDLNIAAEQLSELKQKQDPVSIMLYQTIRNRVEENSDCNKAMFSASFLRPTLERDWEDEANSEIVLETLRRWNSFTPFVTDSKGGGYFLKVKGEGIVIDPGHSFLDNFRAKGHHFYEIDKILFTHSHSDHTGDFEAMLNLDCQQKTRQFY